MPCISLHYNSTPPPLLSGSPIKMFSPHLTQKRRKLSLSEMTWVSLFNLHHLVCVKSCRKARPKHTAGSGRAGQCWLPMTLVLVRQGSLGGARGQHLASWLVSMLTANRVQEEQIPCKQVRLWNGSNQGTRDKREFDQIT